MCTVGCLQKLVALTKKRSITFHYQKLFLNRKGTIISTQSVTLFLFMLYELTIFFVNQKRAS